MKASVSISTKNLGGNQVQVYGLVTSETGGGLPKAQVQILMKSNSNWTPVTTVISDERGYYSTVVQVGVGSFEFKARFIGGEY